MAWIKFDQSLERHPKLLHLSQLLKVSDTLLIGHLARLWWWALDYAKDGQLRGSPDETALAAGWKKDPPTFQNALIEAGFLDADYKIHDWSDWAGSVFDIRRNGRERVRRFRERAEADALTTETAATTPAQGNGDVTVTDALRNGHVTEPDKIREDKIREEERRKDAQPLRNAPDGGRPVSQPAAMKDHRSDFRAPGFDQFHEEVTRAAIPLKDYFAGSPRLKAFASDKWNGQEVKGWEGCRDWRAFARQVASWYYADHEKLIARPGVEDLDYMDYVDACNKKNLALQEEADRQRKAESAAFMSTPEGRAKAEKWQAEMRALMAETMDALGPAAQQRQEAEYAAKVAKICA
jgi:hypothetical protein